MTQSIIDFPHFGNQSAEFLSELLKKPSCFLANAIFHCYCLKLEKMLYKTDETGTVMGILIKRLHFAVDFLILRDLIILLSATLAGSLLLTLQLLRTCDRETRIFPHFSYIFLFTDYEVSHM